MPAFVSGNIFGFHSSNGTCDLNLLPDGSKNHQATDPPPVVAWLAKAEGIWQEAPLV
jgi:hypothetical protein